MTDETPTDELEEIRKRDIYVVGGAAAGTAIAGPLGLLVGAYLGSEVAERDD